MAYHNGFSFDDAVPGRERIRIMLLAKGAQLSDFAEKKGACATRSGEKHLPSEVSMCLSGTRLYEGIRQDLADFLEIERSTIDAWIDGEPAEEVA